MESFAANSSHICAAIFLRRVGAAKSPSWWQSPHLAPSDFAISFITLRRVRGSSFSMGGRLFASRPNARRSSIIAVATGAFMSTAAGSSPAGVEALAPGAGPGDAGAPGSALTAGPAAADDPGGAGAT